jgi:hypothetical protein
MEGISENYKKKSRRVKRGNVKTKRNFRKKTVQPTNNSNVNTNNNENTNQEEDLNQEGGFFKNLFSWF